MNLTELLHLGVEKEASDIHITVGKPPILRVNGELFSIDEDILKPEDAKRLIFEALSEKMILNLEKDGEIDTSLSTPGIGRYRINAFKQRGSYGMVLRIIPLKIPSMDDLNLPNSVRSLSEIRRGLILVTGPTGSGKSTTLASQIGRAHV